MAYKLGTNVKVGQKILTGSGWEKIITVDDRGVTVKSGFIKFGDTIYGWKIR